MSEADVTVMWTFSKDESTALEVLYYMGMSFFIVYLMVMLFVPVLSSFRLL